VWLISGDELGELIGRLERCSEATALKAAQNQPDYPIHGE